MKLNDQFIMHQVDDQTVLLPIEGAPFHGLVQGNKSVRVILECLQQDTTEEAITDELCRRFQGDREAIRADVADVVTRLKEIGAIVD